MKTSFFSLLSMAQWRKIALISLLVLLAFAMPARSHAENGTFGDCVNAFVEQYAYYETFLESKRVLADCSLPGRGNNVGSELRVEIYSLAKNVAVGAQDVFHIGMSVESNVNAGPMGCAIRQWMCSDCSPEIAFPPGYESSLMAPVSISLSKRDARKWTNFVKRDVCSLAKSGL